MRTGGTIARFFQGVARFLQTLTNRPFGCLCAVLNGLTRFHRSFLNGFASLFDRTLILSSHCEEYAK